MRIRLKYAFLIIFIILFGLSTRKLDFYPSFIQEHFGDALWAAMVYFSFRILLLNRPLLFSLIYALLFSYFIEVSQLYQAPWINNIRKTTLGALILGNGLLLYDFVRYTAGVVFSYLADNYFIKMRIKKTP